MAVRALAQVGGLFRGLMCIALHLRVDERLWRRRLLQHAPALEPLVGALHLVERDRRRIADHQTALAQVFHLERSDLRIGIPGMLFRYCVVTMWAFE